jgi:LDH2 family malate/lactate/ureidoglycolate dehydrogenase
MRVDRTDLFAAIAGTLTRNGASPAQAEAAARHMVWCEMAGRHNFGIERIPIHVRRMKAGVLDGKAVPVETKLAPALARIDGAGGFGYLAAEQAMASAIALARQSGIGAAGVVRSNFFGAGAYSVNMAAESGMVGLAFSNSFPKVVAHGGLKPVLGTNPFAFGAPHRDGRHLLVDMATSALAGSTVRQHKAEGTPLPKGLAIDAEGRPLTDPDKVPDGALLPFGGPKGFALSLMVEVLAGVVAGAGIGPGVASIYADFTRNGDNGHFMLAIDVTRFMPRDDYFNRLDSLVALVRSSGPGVLLPGEVRWQAMDDALANGVEVDDAKWNALPGL